MYHLCTVDTNTIPWPLIQKHEVWGLWCLGLTCKISPSTWAMPKALQPLCLSQMHKEQVILVHLTQKKNTA